MTAIRSTSICRNIENHQNDQQEKDTKKYYFSANYAIKELYDLYIKIINTFEIKRLMHLQMTGFLSFKYPSSTHTRYAHIIGTWICGLIAIQNIVVRTENCDIRLIDFLAEQDMHREFMAALILHDVGHAPYSHVLEMNPYLKYDHEDVTKGLIRGGHSSNSLELNNLLFSSYLDLEHGLNDHYGVFDPNIFKENYGTPGDHKLKSSFTLINDVINFMGMDKEIIVELISDDKSNKRDPAVTAIKGLVDGILDIDRIDHIYRDLHYNSFKTMGIPLTSFYHGITIHHDKDNLEESYMVVSPEITPIIETLLAAREQSNKAIFDNLVNNFYIGVLNSSISDAIILMPLLEYYIPYLTDESLLHILTNKNLFQNLSPTKKIGIITSSGFEHQNYKS